MRYLLYGLYGVQALLGLAVIGTLFGAFIMAFPNGLRDSLMSGLEGSNWSETTSRITIGFFMASLVAIVWFYVLNILRKIVVTIIKGDPFIHDNISRLRRMWVMIAAVEILRIIFNLAFPLHTNTDMTISFKFETWFLVFIFAILSEAFRYGAEMRRDQELTI
ncbi:MAG: DUF2975 domain-containing protein [Litorimonas sp.]